MAGKKSKNNYELMRAVIPLAMRPFVRILLRYGITYSVFSDIVKQVFVEVAQKDFTIPGRKQSHARIALLTGLTRREVKSSLEEQKDTTPQQFSFNRAARVFSGWMQDREFSRIDGQPKTLSTTAKDEGSFDALASKYGGDIPTRALLDELLQQGAIERVGPDAVMLITTGYTPKGDSVKLLGTGFKHVGDLFSTIDHNDQHPASDSRLQLAVDYDNVTPQGADVFRLVSREKCKELLLYLDQFLATQDSGSNPTLHQHGSLRTGVGVYYFEEPLEETEADEE